MSKKGFTEKVILVTKIDRAAIEAQIAEHGVAVLEPPQDDDCELEAISGDLLFWEAEVEVDEGDDDEDEED
ncbi:MAG: hypothetical protein ACOYKM_01465 [Caulobacterales bacterium]|jgi:hypothetical protein